MSFLIQHNIENKSKFTYGEVKKDLIGIDEICMASKKKLNAKYNVGSNKWKDIAHDLYLVLQTIRLSRNAFDSEDIADFKKIWDNGIPETYNKLKEVLDNDNIEFVRYFCNWQLDYLKAKCTTNKKTLYDYIFSPLPKDWNYFMSASEKYQLMIGKNLVRYLNENHIDIF